MDELSELNNEWSKLTAELIKLKDNDDEDLILDKHDDSSNNINFENPAEAAKYYVDKNSIKAKHCWDWVEQVYNKSGFDRVPVWQDINYEGRIAGSHRASKEQLNSLKPGDWLFINNRNTSDTHGNHSVIFLGWRGDDVADVASFYDNKAHIHYYTLSKYPVTAIQTFKKSSNKKIQAFLNILSIIKRS